MMGVNYYCQPQYDDASIMLVELLKQKDAQHLIGLANDASILAQAKRWHPAKAMIIEAQTAIQYFLWREMRQDSQPSIADVEQKANNALVSFKKSNTYLAYNGVPPKYYATHIHSAYESLLLLLLQFSAAEIYLIRKNPLGASTYEALSDEPIDFQPLLALPKYETSNAIDDQFIYHLNTLRILGGAAHIYASRVLSPTKGYIPELGNQIQWLVDGLSKTLNGLVTLPLE